MIRSHPGRRFANLSRRYVPVAYCVADCAMKLSRWRPFQYIFLNVLIKFHYIHIEHQITIALKCWFASWKVLFVITFISLYSLIGSRGRHIHQTPRPENRIWHHGLYSCSHHITHFQTLGSSLYHSGTIQCRASSNRSFPGVRNINYDIVQI